jgi:hypothetical protein
MNIQLALEKCLEDTHQNQEITMTGFLSINTHLITRPGNAGLSDISRIPKLLVAIFHPWEVRGNEIRSQPTRGHAIERPG